MSQAADRYRRSETRALLQWALQHQREGRLADATSVYELVLRRQPRHFDALHMLGVLAMQTQHPERAVTLITEALSQNPASAAAHGNLAEAFMALRRFEEAVNSYGMAIALRPGYADTYLGRANALRELGRPEEALGSCDQAVILRPDLARAYICRALILRSMQRYEETLACCDRALLTQPDLPDAWDKLGAALREVNHFEEALGVFEIASNEWPDLPSPRMNAGTVHLQLGRTEPGWQLYDWRNKPGGPVPGRVWSKPRWYGEESLTDKTILLWSEQGLGDTIQFCRYATLLESRGAHVILSVQAGLCALLKTLSPTVRVVAESEAPPAFDVHCPLLSLPLAFGTTTGSVPATTPYLTADPDRVLHWRQRLGTAGFRIGICWQGSTLPIDTGRSFPLKLFDAISRIAGIRLISLQKGPGSEQLRNAPAGMTVETLGDDYDAGPDGFLDSAAVMGCLDLVVTSDTSIAHLAGALGCPTWLVLRNVPEWRWLLDREDSPWYPHHRLYRQETRGDWQSIFDRMYRELRTRCDPERGRERHR